MLVSCITPITESRRHYMPVVDNIIRSQTYPNIEHIYLWGVGTIGEKRNKACEQAKGDIILHIDSDDIYSNDWVALQVDLLLSTGADVCGLKNIYFLDKDNKEAWQYRWANESSWVAGATMCYLKSFWQKHPFRDVQVAEDYYFLDGGKVIAGTYEDKFIASLHSDNTAPHRKSSNWHRCDYTALSNGALRICGG